MMKISQRQFDRALDLIQRGLYEDTDAGRELHARIVMAVASIVKHRQGISDDAEWEWQPEQGMPAALKEFLADLSAIQRKLLKRIAQDLELQVDRLH
jgi:hypothetical protein